MFLYAVFDSRFWFYWVVIEMEDVVFSCTGNGVQVDRKVVQTLQKNFVQVQNILDQNRLLINEINQNHESTIPDNLTRNVGLIRELNNNIRRVVDLYADLSSSVTTSMEAFSEGESNNANQSDQRDGQKRIRSSWSSTFSVWLFLSKSALFKEVWVEQHGYIYIYTEAISYNALKINPIWSCVPLLSFYLFLQLDSNS